MPNRAFVFLLLLGSTAHADPDHVLRIGTLIPDGSAWGREARAFQRNVEEGTGGKVKMKVYYGAVTGDEDEQLARIKKGQLDGAMAGLMCERIAPSMRILRLPGLFESREEAAFVMNALYPELEAEAAKAGFVMPATGGMGADVYFTKTPVHNMAELRRIKLWRWTIDDVGIAMAKAMGMNVVPSAVNGAAHSFEVGEIEGMTAIPQAALAWQWSSRARYVTDLPGSYLWGCMVLSSAKYQQMTPEQRTAFRTAAAQFSGRIEAVGKVQDEELLSGKFRAQGSIPVPVSPAFRTEYFSTAATVREQVGDRFVPRALLDRVLRMLADYRVEHLRSSR